MTTKEAIVILGHGVLLEDQAAHGCVTVQGYKIFGPYQAETVNMMRVGNRVTNEYFASRRRVNNGVRTVDNGLMGPMAILRHFGLDHAVSI